MLGTLCIKGQIYILKNLVKSNENESPLAYKFD